MNLKGSIKLFSNMQWYILLGTFCTFLFMGIELLVCKVSGTQCFMAEKIFLVKALIHSFAIVSIVYSFLPWLFLDDCCLLDRENRISIITCSIFIIYSCFLTKDDFKIHRPTNQQHATDLF